MNATAPVLRPNFDVARIREDFPILSRPVHGKPLVFLDSGASAQKPRQVIEAMSRFQEQDYANVHRGVHWLSQRASDAYEGARSKVARFINAPSPETIVFTRNATEAVNLVAASWGRTLLQAGDEVLITELEHHANIVPWQLLRAEKGIVLKVAPVDGDGNVELDVLEALIGPRTRLISVAHISNVLGTVLPVRGIIERAHARGIPVLLDGCQAVPHMRVDVQALDADFYVFSGHKLYGPTGIGVLYGKAELLDAMPPYQGGGDMILSVSFEETIFQKPPFRFEAGTPAITEAVGLAAAIDYVDGLGLDAIHAHEHDLLGYCTERLSAIPGLEIHGRAREKASIVSFTLAEAHPHDIGTILDRDGVAIRTGNHCAEPLMRRLDLPGTARASFGLYNTREDVDALAASLGRVQEMFG